VLDQFAKQHVKEIVIFFRKHYQARAV
jgi:hypothetical protein